MDPHRWLSACYMVRQILHNLLRHLIVDSVSRSATMPRQQSLALCLDRNAGMQQGKGREGKGRGGEGREGRGGKGREGKGREGKGREGKGNVC